VDNLDIIYKDSSLVCINKPNDLLVHSSKIAQNTNLFAVQILRNQLDTYVYPVHRLDRKTAGALLFALNPETNTIMQQQFMNKEVKKKYFAIVRGYAPESGIIDYPLINDKGKKQEAITHFKRLQTVEIALSSGKYNSSRYSLVEIYPETGRMHQIRKHFAHIYYPIIGDRPYGCNKQNRFFKETWGQITMLLHAYSLSFKHPHSNSQLIINAPILPNFANIAKVLGFNISSF